MKCPSCDESVADDVAICPKCDAVLDASLFDNTPKEPDDATEPVARPLKSGPGAKKPLPRRPAGSAPPASGRSSSAVKQPAKARPGGQAMPEAPGRKLKEAAAAREDWHAKVEPRAPPKARDPADGLLDPEDFFTEVKHFFLELTVADKLAFIGATLTLLSCFLPWKDSITDGDVLGLMSLGAAVFAVAVLILFSIVIRVRKVMPALHALVPWLVQFGGACFCIVWCLVYMKLSLDTTMARSPIGNSERWISSPSAGVVIALVMSVMTLAGTLMGLKEKPPR